MNETKRLHRDCDPHEAADCDINDHSRLEPGADDCGHRVESGPGEPPQATVNRKPFCAPDPNAPSSINGDQDSEHGPGVK